MAYAMFLNLFLLGAELFKEYYSATEHLLYTQYFWQGIGEHRALVPYAWLSLACSVAAFVLFLVPRTRKNYVTLNLGCVLIWAGVYIEKGMGLIIPGFTPDTLGRDLRVPPDGDGMGASPAGVFGIGFLVFTVLVKIAVPILVGTFRAPERADTRRARRPPPAFPAHVSASPRRIHHEALRPRPRRPASPPRRPRRRPRRREVFAKSAPGATARTARAARRWPQKMGVKDISALASSEDEIEKVIESGKGKMSAFKGKLTDAEIEALAKYVKAGLK